MIERADATVAVALLQVHYDKFGPPEGMTAGEQEQAYKIGTEIMASARSTMFSLMTRSEMVLIHQKVPMIRANRNVPKIIWHLRSRLCSPRSLLTER